MNQTRLAVSGYICDLIMAICAIIGAVAQLRHVVLNWQASTEEQHDSSEG